MGVGEWVGRMFGTAEPRLRVLDGRGRDAERAIAGAIAWYDSPRAADLARLGADLARLGAGARQGAPSAGSGQI